MRYDYFEKRDAVTRLRTPEPDSERSTLSRVTAWGMLQSMKITPEMIEGEIERYYGLERRGYHSYDQDRPAHI